MPGKLYYFDVGGRGESIRSLLSHASVRYTDERISGADFGKMKAAGDERLPLGSMPVWEEDGFRICQSNAILRTLGIRFGYYSEDPEVAYAIDSLLDFAEDIWHPIGSYIRPAVFGGTELDVEEGVTKVAGEAFGKII